MSRLRVTDLDKFSFEQIWRPYWPTYVGSKPGDPLPRITKAPFNLDETALELGMETEWRNQVVERLAAIGVTFPVWVQHPLLDVLTSLLNAAKTEAPQ